MHKMVMAAVAMTAVTTWSTPTRACSLLDDDTWGQVSFQQRKVPLNAELWVNGVDELFGPDDIFAIVGPDGVTQPATLERDGPGGRFVIAEPLVAGVNVLQVTPVWEGETFETGSYEFTVIDDIDTTAPAAPIVTVESVTTGGNPLDQLLGNDCGPRERTTIRVIDIQLTDGADVARVLVDGVAFNGGNDYVSVANREEDGSDVVVVAIDHAGNESETVIASPVARGGCASVPAAPTSLLALGLLVRRRQRRRR